MAIVSVKVHAPGSTIVMDYPQMGNALSIEMIEQLEQAFDDLHQEKKVRFVILAGAGKHFSTGMNLRELHESTRSVGGGHHGLPSDDVHDQWVRVSDLLQKILRFPKPVLAAVDGDALGAGFGLALAADIIVAAEGARFSSPAARIGLIGGVVAPLLHFRLGGSVAANLLLTGRSLGTEEAKQLGLVSEVVRADQVWVVAEQLGKLCSAGPAESVQLTKRLLNETIGEQLHSLLTIGAGMGATACSTESAAEGLRAFVEKRQPTWP